MTEEWQRGGAPEAANGGGLSLSRGRRRAQRSTEERGRGAVRARGSHRPFIGVGGSQRGVAGGSNGGVNGFNAIEDGGEDKRGLKGGG
jgi:hypothetical protein